MAIDCEAAEQRRHAHVDRRLSEAERGEVERHLAACPNCRARFELEARLGRLRERPPTADGGAALRPVPGRALLRHFTLISLALTLLATAGTTLAMGWLVDSYLLGRAALEAGGRLDRVVLAAAPPEELARPFGPEAAARLDAAVRAGLLEPAVRRVALWNRAGELVYQSAPTGRAAGPGLVAAALRDGARHEVVAGPDGRQLRLLVPVVREGVALGLYELEQNFEPLAWHIREMQLFAGASLAGFSVALYLLLFRLVRRAARDLASEAAANARLTEEAQRAGAIAGALLQTAEALARLVPLDQLLEDVAARAVQLLGADDALVFLMDDERRRMVLRASAGVPPEKLAAFPLRAFEPALVPAFARLCAGGGPIAIEDAPGSPLLPEGLAAWYGASSCVLLPLEVGERREGAMVVHFNRAPHRLTPEELRLATGLAGQAAVALANSRAVETVGEVEALREVNRLKGELVAVVTHELRGPLTGVIGFAELLAAPSAPPERTAPIAAALLQEALRLNRLVDDLLDLGRLESGRFALAREPIDLAAFAEEVAARLAPTAPKHRIRVEVASPATIAGDRHRLRQVLDNLVANAVRYSPDGGPVVLAVGGTDEGGAYAAVRDAGLGIAAEDLGRLFERFYRSARSEVRAIKGTGLGLAIAQAIVAAHGGALRVASPGPGRGSTFTVELPAATPGAAPAVVPTLAGQTA